ncbi:helical backbone metal receptor [Antarcticibacterium sp. 1MA-6-2]|uniref:ABC transporter substrate-binding protein n=1 Tax=Antarcticibacterium sp. 1MA-6-2 TaxID=2908210 RepID=UPI001F3C16E9|nr:helical backbone metal receptor [Antarcticibacterium sp. 1MA-6-2]UJH92601.1 helical backbone metal receptor [Antarcticibacterium sp. 1MA-6-2]
MIFRDQLQREIPLNKTPRRIISLVPSQTELLCDLGLQNSLVGVTKFCVHPQNIRKSKTVVGGTKNVHLEKIAALNPDIILCNKEENTQEMVEELTKIAPVHLSNVITFEDSLDLIFQYGEIFEIQETTAALVKNIIDAKNRFEEEGIRTRLKVVYLIWKKPWMAVGGETFINSLIEINGWENLFKNNKDRYPEITLNDLEMLKPDLVLLSSEPFPFKEKHVIELGEQIKANIQLVDGEYFSWYGSRLLPAFNYFKEYQIKLSNFL